MANNAPTLRQSLSGAVCRVCRRSPTGRTLVRHSRGVRPAVYIVVVLLEPGRPIPFLMVPKGNLALPSKRTTIPEFVQRLFWVESGRRQGEMPSHSARPHLSPFD